MSKGIGLKQSSSNQAWIEAKNAIQELISAEELKELTCKVVAEIEEMTQGKKVAYAYSGGKDSIVLGHICEQVGIMDAMIGLCDLEYPAFLTWIEAHGPKTLTKINTGLDLTWLAKHQEMLFPQDSIKTARWFAMVQHKAQAQYYKDNGLDLILLGRRTADGNYVGKGGNSYTNNKGMTYYSPLAYWSHEHILAYLHYHQLPLPPIYDWPNGYKCGTHPWPARPYTSSIAKGWAEVYGIDPTIVENAAQMIDSAKEFLASRYKED